MRLPLQPLHTYIACSLFLFALVQSLKVFQISAPNWVFFYLNDFLTIPIVSTICLHGVWLLKKNKAIRLNGFTILSLVLIYSFYFEYYLPHKSHRYTGDLWDVVCYAIGGLVFYFLQKLD